MSQAAPLRVGLIQTRTPATHAAALDHVAPLVREAIAGGAQFVLTPECTNVVQKDRSLLLPALKTLDEDPVVSGLREIAAQTGTWIDVGSALVRREAGEKAAVLASQRSDLAGQVDGLKNELQKAQDALKQATKAEAPAPAAEGAQTVRKATTKAKKGTTAS